MAGNFAYFNQNYQNADGKTSRVYINPNFNRQDNLQPSSNKMYLNPNFPQVSQNINYNNFQQFKDQAAARIHVNPNFIRNSNNRLPTVTNDPDSTYPPINIPSCVPSTSSKEFNLATDIRQQPMHVAKSRYCLVRQKENVVKSNNIPTKPVTATVRVSKYKSVSLNVVKNIIASTKPTKSIEEASHAKQFTSKTAFHDNAKYKLVKPSTSNTISQVERKSAKCAAARRPYLLNKSISSSLPQKINKLKKNNIPCPQFKKYGTCLRKFKGCCEYSHDKKHVSICRKFLKGVCHDAHCLLSHDLTDKKMPTCYFYLKGACTKENCPYLHVKLNEKTKICQDFLKGYCEKGKKCLFRHVSVLHGLKSLKALRKYSPYSSGSKSNYIVKKQRKKSLVMLNKEQNTYKGIEDVNFKEQRYYKELSEDKCASEKSDSIKPSRVKLGTLPSFIQL